MVKRNKPLHSTPCAAVAIEHNGFYPYLMRYLETLKIRGYRKSTLYRRESDLRRFIGWSDERDLQAPNEITKPILESYQRYLYYYRQAHNQQPLSPASQNRYISSVKPFFKWLCQENHILYNPASELILAKERTSLPVVLTEEEIDELLRQPDTGTPYGLRDRAILELFYSTGIRRTEMCHLLLSDLSLSRRTLHIREGKGNKDRLIPVGERAIHWLSRYLNENREQLLLDIKEQQLFLNDYGEPMKGNSLGSKMKHYLTQAGIDVPGSCHLLRHAMATHMLENGADIRFIQAMLGHAKLNTTQIYTHVSIRKLQEVHANTHPAKLVK